MLRNRFTQLGLLLLLSAVTTVAIAAPPPGKGGGNGGGGGDDGGSGSGTGPAFTLEILDISGNVRDFNDRGDVLIEIDVIVGSSRQFTYVLATLDSGSRSFETVQLPPGWTELDLEAMNNSRQLVGRAVYDPAGDGVDADQDGQLDPGDIASAGVCITPDANDDGIWELAVIFPGPLSGMCHQINNDGDIVGQDDFEEGNILYRPDLAWEPFPIYPFALQVGNQLSDRDGNDDVIGINSGTFYTPRKYETKTGEVTVLPTFARATFLDAYAFTVNVFGEAVGRADTFPAMWSPSGEISRIPGWPKSKNATGSAYGINSQGEIAITSSYEGAHLYSPVYGLVRIADAITNREVIPEGYLVSRLFYINDATQLAGTLNSDSGDPIPCVLHPVPQQ